MVADFANLFVTVGSVQRSGDVPNNGVRIRAAQTALAVKKKTWEYQVAVSDGLYNVMCPDAAFPGGEEPNVYLLNESDDPQMAIAIFAEPEATREGGLAHGILESIKPWLIVNDWCRGIVRVPMGDDHELSVDYDGVARFSPNLTRCLLRSRHWNTQLFGQHADETEFLCAQSAFFERSFVDIPGSEHSACGDRAQESSGSTMESETIGEPARRRTYHFC